MIYYISTEIDGEIITQVSKITDVDSGVVFNLTKAIVNTKERQMREALLKLGWTPPLAAPDGEKL